MSLPNQYCPFDWGNSPEVDVISELHQGCWWGGAWEGECNPEKGGILVPLALHISGISLDKHPRLTSAPLKMTLVVRLLVRFECWENSELGNVG